MAVHHGERREQAIGPVRGIVLVERAVVMKNALYRMNLDKKST
jgi:hypothetical protein